MISFKAVQRALGSLEMSTDLTIITDAFRITVDGRNSIYVLNQKVDFGRGHNVPGSIFLANGNYSLVITTSGDEADNVGCLSKKVPAVLLKSFRYLSGIPILAQDDKMFYYCYVPNTFQGYDEDGEIIFSLPEVCNAGGIDLYSGKNIYAPKIKRHGDKINR